jgi:hypothetical protein
VGVNSTTVEAHRFSAGNTSFTGILSWSYR